MTVVSVCVNFISMIFVRKQVEMTRDLSAAESIKRALSVHCQLARTSPPARVYQSLSSVTQTEEKGRQGQMGTITSSLSVSVCFIGMTIYATCVLLMQFWIS